MGCFLLPVIWDAPIRAQSRPAYVYYSIHLASFKNLRNANRQVNSLKTKGKIVFWRQTDVPGKGMFYRVYLGKYTDRDEAVKFWKKLKKEGAVSYFGVHEFIETAPPMPPEIPEAEIVPDVPETVQKERRETGGKRFVDNGDGTITDSRNRLMWIKNGWRLDFFSAVKWNEALVKCQNFRLAGYDDWRLPTIEEWMGLIDRNHQYPAMVSPNPFVNIIVHMPYWSKTEYVYQRNHMLSKRRPFEACTVMLYAGTIHHQKKTARAFIMPVRSLEPNEQ